MSGLWTPSGEHVPGGGDEPDEELADDELTDEEVADELRRVRAEISSTPVADIVANHAVGLWQLAVLHLTPEGGAEPRLDEAGLAIDALAALVDGVGDRLGEHAGSLRDGLTQLRLAYVQVQTRS
ncbi:MAG TPA: hypothetical protein VFC99_15900 [Acidimicrobiia bacterium]|nr:hypothetical protein [Acidimicrobiia bacterium]